MSISYEELEKEILMNYENHLNGDYNCLPFSDYGAFSDVLPGVERGTYYILTASSGVGKSKLMRHMFITNPLRYIEGKNYRLSIKYFSLEESVKKVVYSEILSELYRRHNIRISLKQFLSIGEGNRFDIELMDKVRDCKGYIDKYLESVEVIDTIKKPSDIFKCVRNFACEVGYHFKHDGTIMNEQEVDRLYSGKTDAYGFFSHYRVKDPNHYVIILIDHLSLILPEKGIDKRSSMELFSSQYCIPFRDKYGFSIVVVQQQSADREGSDKDNEPSLEGLGDCKTTQRDADVVLGLYNPSRYGRDNHNGIMFGNKGHEYRSIRVLKNRNGGVGTSYPFRFYGESGHFQNWYSSSSDYM